MNNEIATVRLFASGPLALLFLLSCLSITALAATGLGWADKLAGLSARAANRLERGRLLPTLWGLSATILVFAACGVLLSVKPIALLGVVLGLAGLALTSLGVGAACLMVGGDLCRALGEEGMEPSARLRLGLGALFCATLLPFAGWTMALLAAAAGIGAVVEALLPSRR